MKLYSGMKAEKSSSRAYLPVGGYAAEILNIDHISYSWGDVLVFNFEICEGKYSGFFKKDYDAQQSEDKKWRGKFRVTWPDENSQYFESNRRTFNNVIYAIESSNEGYHMDVAPIERDDFSQFKRKKVGVLFRNEEWENDRGDTGWKTECCSFIPVDDAKNGNFKMPKDKPLKNKAPAAAIPDFKEEPYTGKLPWD